MATGRDTQLTKQIGDYLVTAELGRLGLIATTFTGNVPHFDILAADAEGEAAPIQVKAIREGDWQFDIRQFVSLERDQQILGVPMKPPQPKLTCVFVVVGAYGADRFFVFDWAHLQQVVVAKYRAYLDSKGGIRPKRHDSYHTAVSPDDLREYADNWDLIKKRVRYSV